MSYKKKTGNAPFQTRVPSNTGRSGLGALIAGGLVAILASVCCLGPLLLVVLGISGAWIGTLTRLELYRPYFLLAAVVSLFFAGRRIFRPAGTCQADKTCDSLKTKRIHKALFIAAVLLVLIAVTFPYAARYFY